jgi:asparagine synthase (glutamine-hydrolysing)
MCGISGAVIINQSCKVSLKRHVKLMCSLQAHRGPDGEGVWENKTNNVCFGHNRLAIIDLDKSAGQPMVAKNETTITHNGEIYNYKELQSQFSSGWDFSTNSDTECILAAYDKYGLQSVDKLRGMFSFGIWDEKNRRLFCARDRFGIKPFYYTLANGVFYFSSEAKALVPFLDEISTDTEALNEYLTFQYTLGEKTLFKGIYQLLPGHALTLQAGEVKKWQYWDLTYEVNFEHSPSYFRSELDSILKESVELHGVSDVPVGAYVSGGVDSSLIYSLARHNDTSSPYGFNGKFTEFGGYDESSFAKSVTKSSSGILKSIDIKASDFESHINDVIYHLDFPVAGPGSFPQFMVSKLASQYVKVVLGGQGGDEIFGGYARYLVAYLEQTLKAAIDGTYAQGNYVVTLESVIPNLNILKEYKPMIKKFWKDGLFNEMDERYFSLIDRSRGLENIINSSFINREQSFESFRSIFNDENRVRKDAYFDRMTRFDFKCLLPALLHVEDRMSMAHGIESRVPFLDHKLIEFSATIPADIKFQGGKMKQLLKDVFKDYIPPGIFNRRDKMGFPVPLSEWFEGELATFYMNTMNSMVSNRRPFINHDMLIKDLSGEEKFSRKSWALISLELWHQNYHDKAHEWKKKLNIANQ